MAMAQPEREHMSVVMFPWLAHGHIIPFLELAMRLTTVASDVDVVVHLVSTPANLASLPRHRTDKIKLVELHLPALPDLPPALHTTKSLPAHLMPSLKRAFDLAAPRFGAVLDEIRPDILVYDFIQPWAPLEAAARGLPAVQFSTCSAVAMAFMVHGVMNETAPRAFPFEAVCVPGPDEVTKYTVTFPKREDIAQERDRLVLSFERSSEFVALKTCADIERSSKYMDYLSQLIGKEVVPTGPLLADGGGSLEDHGGSERILRWLDGEQPGSVVLVALGTEYFMSERQMAQMARGLELSGVPFLWVVRFPDADANACGAAPPTVARGMVVEGWVPQRRVLSHPSCGAFLTHCGWSSVLESMGAGVPMVSLPLHLDQPLNANLAADVGAVAACVKQERFGEFTAEEVARAVRAAVNGREGEAARHRARELQEVVARNNGDDQHVGALLQRMTRLCGKGLAVPNQ